MAFPSGWTYKCPITIDYTKVPAATTNQPVLLTASNLPATLFTTCSTTGADIMFASDSLGTTQYPRDIVSINTTTSTIAIYILIPSISNTANTTFWVFWGNSAATEPGNGSASQSTLVWSKWYGVDHFTNITTSWKGVKDSSGQWNGMTVIGTLPKTWPTGHAPGLTAFPESTTLGLTLHEYINFAGLTMDLMFWCNFNGTLTTGNIATGTNGIPLGWLTAGQFGVGWGSVCSTASVAASGWHLVVMSIVAGTGKVYIDGVDRTSGSSTASAINFNTLGLGTTTSPAFYMSEFRMTRNNTLSVAQIQCMYANESAPTTFCSAGTVQTNPVTYTLTLTGLITSSEVRIYNAGTTTQVAGIETSTTTFSYTYTYTGDFKVDIHILNLNYEWLMYTGYTLSSSNNTIPIQQIYDRNYNNPS